MQPMPWSMSTIKQCEKEIKQEMLKEELQLSSYAYDFGRINQVVPTAVCIPSSQQKLQTLLAYANHRKLKLTIRAHGMSQGGQSLATTGGVILQLAPFNPVPLVEQDTIWVDANITWSQLVAESLKTEQLPYVLPYNTNLSIGGVLSAGGIGAASFKYGTASSHVSALEVTKVNGEIALIEESSDLFHACLSGQGRFAVINKACIKLRPCLPQVRTFFLVYLDKEQWLHDLATVNAWADYVEAFCSPALQGARLTVEGKRFPFAQWLFALHVSVEYKHTPPNEQFIRNKLTPWQFLHRQDESIVSYIHRHNSRLEMMKATGQWKLAHPWYECYLPMQILEDELEEILATLPVHYTNLLHVVPIHLAKPVGFFMLPQGEKICELMILNPGVVQALLPDCMHTIRQLDERFLKQGGKRYLSGYLGSDLSTTYWQTHFGNLYNDWLALKEKYDPEQILGSWLYPHPLN